MADNKKYYYLKLKDNFYDSEEMIILQNMPDGYLYSDILMKLYLRSLKNNGKLMFKDVIPYTPSALAQVVRHQVGTVEKSLKIFQELGLIEVLDNGAIYMLDIQNFIGESSTEADRIRKYRAKIKEDKEGVQMLQQMYDKCTPEIEIELEKDIELEKELKAKEKKADTTSAENCFKFYMENINPLITQYEIELLNDYLKDLSDELIIYAIKEAVEHNARSMKYIKSILERYVRQNIKTLEQLKAIENIKQNTKEETEEEKKARKIKELEEAIANDN